MSTPSRRQPALLLTLAGVLVAGLLTTVAAAGHPTRANAEQPPAHARVRLTATVLPSAHDPSGTVASSDAADSVVIVTVRPRTMVLRVKLQRRSGSTWHTVATKKARRGEARFPVTTQAGSAYRAVLPARGERPVVRSSVALDGWGPPDFVDEFDGSALGPAWEHRIQFYNPWGGRACSKGSPDAVSVGDGALRLSSMPDPAAHEKCLVKSTRGKPLGHFPYRLNGHVSTQHSADFLYGLAATRMRFPRSLGQHAAFWLQPRGLLETGPTPWGAEIDVVEWYGAHNGKQKMASAVHAPMPDGSKRQIGGTVPEPDRFLATRSDTWWDSFHVFSVEWTPTEYVFRIDGHRVWRTSEGVSHVPEFLILSMLSSDFELPLVGEDPTPRTAEVDWVAFWQAS